MAHGTSKLANACASEGDNEGYNHLPVKELIQVYNGLVVKRAVLATKSPSTSHIEHAETHGRPQVSEPDPLASVMQPDMKKTHPTCPLHLTTLSNQCKDNRDFSKDPIRIFIGTWNCVYQDIEEAVILKPSRKEHQIAQRITRSVGILSHWLTHVFHRLSKYNVGDVTCGSLQNGQSLLSGLTKPCNYCNTRRNGRIHSTGCVPTECSVDSSSIQSPSNSNYSAVPSETFMSVDSIHEKLTSSNAVDFHKDDDSREVYNIIETQTSMTSLASVQSRQTKSVNTTAPASPSRNEPSSRQSKISESTTPSYRNGSVDGTDRLKYSYIDNREGPDSIHRRLRLGKNSGGKFLVNDEDAEFTVRQSTLQLKPLTEDDREPLQDWIKLGYDVYIIALQETLSSNIFTSITKYLQKNSDDGFERVPLEEYKISGYGDGAFLHMKSTSIAVWVRKPLLSSGEAVIGRSKVIPLSLINRSKGVVTFQMRVLGQNICVVGCHMPTRYSDREKAAAYIIKKLPELYGGTGASVEDVFHHILWTGDFNFRVTNISAEKALDLLNNNLREKLFAYDEFNSGGASVFAAMNFVEGKVQFLPTYKKRDDRDIVDRSTPNWAEAEYHTRYETQWYKGGNVKERVPSWTDRVLKWSVPDLHTCLMIDDATYHAAQPTVKNILLASDHSPVGCGLKIWAPKSHLYVEDETHLDTNTN